MRTVSAREFNHDVSAAKRSAETEPVIITDRGHPSFVLLSMQEYERLTGTGRNLVDWLAMEDEPDVGFEPEPVSLDLRVPDL